MSIISAIRNDPMFFVAVFIYGKILSNEVTSLLFFSFFLFFA